MLQPDEPPGALPGDTPQASIARMLRVDHAGEVAAIRIYAGQLAVLRQQPGARASVAVIEQMAGQENAHLAAFERLMNQHRVRPSLLAPVWDVASYGLGVLSALAGASAAMACTVAVEEAISAHYGAQLRELGDDAPELGRLIAGFRADEIKHGEAALANGARDAPAYAPLSEIIKAGCRLAIRLSERI